MPLFYEIAVFIAPDDLAPDVPSNVLPRRRRLWRRCLQPQWQERCFLDEFLPSQPPAAASSSQSVLLTLFFRVPFDPWILHLIVPWTSESLFDLDLSSDDDEAADLSDSFFGRDNEPIEAGSERKVTEASKNGGTVGAK